MSTSNVPNELFDITIVGGGPTGLFAAFYAGMRGMKAKIIESLPQLGGQLAALYPEKYIYDVAGFPKVLAKDLVNQLIEQAFQFPITTCLGESVQRIDREDDGTLVLHTDKGIHRSLTVLITVGMGAFTPKRLDIPGIDAYEGRGLYYFVPQLGAFDGKRVLIVGGGDSAVDWALALSERAQVTLIHRRDAFRAHQHSLDRLRASNVVIKTPYEIRSVFGDGRVEGAVIYHNKTQEEERLELDAIILSLGFHPDLSLVEKWDLELADGGIVVNSRMETSRPGIYAAGDIATYPGKVKLIVVGFGEAATAVNNAATYINPEAKLFPGHSTSRKG